MPTPARTTNDEILAAAVQLVERSGAEALTMKAVAAQVGVQPPSLYKRVQTREHLLHLVVERAARQIAHVLDEAALQTADAAESAVAMAGALRGYAHAHPRSFGLLFADLPEGARPSREAMAGASSAVLAVSERLVGPERALDAARTITAWAFGFLSMELAGAFQLGGNPGEAFEFGARRIVRALSEPA